MAECVSCGRTVEAGKLFCEACYARMKGRRGVLREAGGSRERGREPGYGGADGEAVPGPAGIPAGTRERRGSLTPTSEKKVVILRPEMEKTSKKDRKSRFTVTITLSERTYRMLERLKPGGKKKEGPEAAQPAPTSWGRSRKGPHGRPALRALKSDKGQLRGSVPVKGGIAAWVAFRPRKLDGGDMASLGMAALAVVSILVLTFRPWVRIDWVAGGGIVVGQTTVRGSDLGVLVYVSLALVLAAAAYVPLSLWLRERLGYVDFGLALLLAGLVYIILFYAVISSNRRIVDVAVRLAAAGGGPPADGMERHTSWPAYLVCFMGVVLAFSGLARLSERRSSEGEKEEGGIERSRRG